MVHVGLSDFFRAHQAWYTDRADDAADWGIAAFSGRTAGAAPELAHQEHLYTLVTTGTAGEQYRVIGSIAAVHSGSDVAAMLAYLADPRVSVVTLTVGAGGYLLGDDGGLDVDKGLVVADIAAVAAGRLSATRSLPGRLVAGLIGRREAGAGPISLVSCDRLPDNGDALARVVREFAEAAGADLAGYLDDQVAFIGSLADRVTSRGNETTRTTVLDQQHVDDRAALASERFSEWVLAGEFAGPRPDWGSAGAEFTDDLVPYEHRRLWMQNGARSLLAYAGPLRGHRTVAGAVADPIVLGWVEEWWDVARRRLPLDEAVVQGYRTALLERFGNPSLQQPLSGIAADGSAKLPQRIVPVLVADRLAGNSPAGAERIVAAWTLHLLGRGLPRLDERADRLRLPGEGGLADAVRRVCDFLQIADDHSRISILALARQLGG